MAGKIIADQIEGTTTTETVSGASVTIPNSIDTKYVVNGSAKGYVNYNPTDIIKSLNCSSLAVNGTGDHTLTNISPMLDANYTYGGFARPSNSTANNRGCTPDGEDPTTTQQRYQCCAHANSGAENVEAAFTVIHGDLA